MKKIAITSRLAVDPHTNEVRSGLELRWFDLFSLLNWQPVLIPMSESLSIKGLDLVDGVILSGGNDLAILKPDRINILRDKVETQVLEFALHKKLPVLGVCRGMQFIGNYFGESILPLSGHVNTRHIISPLHSVTEDQPREVNSYHNYGLKTVSFLEATYLAHDGTIEAFEHLKEKVFGIMWHPEREEKLSVGDIKLLSKIFDGVK